MREFFDVHDKVGLVHSTADLVREAGGEEEPRPTAPTSVSTFKNPTSSCLLPSVPWISYWSLASLLATGP